jgi:hypothetical protein
VISNNLVNEEAIARGWAAAPYKKGLINDVGGKCFNDPKYYLVAVIA